LIRKIVLAAAGFRTQNSFSQIPRNKNKAKLILQLKTSHDSNSIDQETESGEPAETTENKSSQPKDKQSVGRGGRSASAAQADCRKSHSLGSASALKLLRDKAILELSPTKVQASTPHTGVDH
jgi:hypothetical protein